MAERALIDKSFWSPSKPLEMTAKGFEMTEISFSLARDHEASIAIAMCGIGVIAVIFQLSRTRNS
jgi:hypothetical protein